MNEDGATVIPILESGDPCITRDDTGKERKGKHKWEWRSQPNGAGGTDYFKGQRCANCGEERDA